MPRLKGVSIGPPSSIGSPMTFMMRPKVAGPTGTVIGRAGVDHVLAADQALGGVHGDGAHGVLAEVLGDLEHQAEGLARPLVGVGGLQRVQDRRQVAVELDVDDGADDLGDAALLGGFGADGLLDRHVENPAYVVRLDGDRRLTPRGC